MATAVAHRFLRAAVVKKILRDLIPRHQIFTVTFIKENGDLRMMNCRRGVFTRVTGSTNRASRPNTNRADRNVICVFDLKENDYRSFRADKVLIIKTSGVLIQAAEEE